MEWMRLPISLIIMTIESADGADFSSTELAQTNQERSHPVSVVILGGNECMERRYQDLCQTYQCQAKVFTKPRGGLKKKLGSPDLMIVFTSTMSHKMLKSALCELKGQDTAIEHCYTSSLSALRTVLEKHTA